MGVIASDQFNRTGGSAGGLWQGATTSFTTNGSRLLNATTSTSLLRYSTIEAEVAHVQSWVLLGTTNTSARAGVSFWDALSDNYFYAAFGYSSGLRVYLVRVVNNSPTVVASSGVLPGSYNSYNSWHRLSVDTYGEYIRVYVDDLYYEANQGPVISAKRGVTTWTGTRFGIVVISPPASNTCQWDGFVAGDGEPMTVYHRYGATATYEEDGSSARPDRLLGYALNNVLTARGSKIKDHLSSTLAWGNSNRYSTTSPGTGYAGPNTIGHAEKFGNSGLQSWTFPEYSVDTGACIDAGHPNLIFEGRDSATPTTVQSDGDDLTWATIDGESYAAGLVFRGLKFDEEGDAAPYYRGTVLHVTANGDIPITHAVSFDKCYFRSRWLDTNYLVDVEGRAHVRTRFCGSEMRTDVPPVYPDQDTCLIRVHNGGRGTVDLRHSAFIADVRFLVSWDWDADWGTSADRSELNHVTFARYATASYSTGAAGLLSLARPDLFRGQLTVRNSILGQVQYTSYNATHWGLVTGTGTRPPAGNLLQSHHNGFWNLNNDLNRRYNYAIWTTQSPGADIVASPGFTTTDLVWRHTEGSGINNEGTFRPGGFTLLWDIRGLTSGYQNAADDRSPDGHVLDLGGVQDYRLSVPITPGGTYCPTFLYDSRTGGLDESLSARLMTARTFTMEREYELRSYRAQDIHVELMDADGLLNPGRTQSLLVSATGEPDWKNRRCLMAATRELVPGTPVALTTAIGYLDDVENRPGVATFRLSDRYEFMAKRTICANQMGRVWAVARGAQAEAQGVYPFYSPPTCHVAQSESPGFCVWGCKVNDWARPGTWTFEIVSTRGDYVCTGSETGYEGTGIVGRHFSPKSRMFTLGAYQEPDPLLDYSYWPGLGAATAQMAQSGNTPFVVGAQFGFELVLRLPEIPGDPGIYGFGRFPMYTPQGLAGAGTSPIGSVLVALLTSLEGAGTRTWDPHPAADVDVYNLDPSIYATITSGIGATSANYFVWNYPIRVLDAVQEVAHHMGGIVIPASGGKLAFVSYLPREMASDPPLLCERSDLMELEMGHAPQYDRVVAQYDWDLLRSVILREERFEGYDVSAPVSASNLEASPIQLRAHCRQTEDTVLTILQALYQRYKRRRRIFRAKTKIDRMAAELTDVYSIEATALAATPAAVEVVSIRKEWVGDLTIELEAVDVSALLDGATVVEPAFIRVANAGPTNPLYRGYGRLGDPGGAVTDQVGWFLI